MKIRLLLPLLVLTVTAGCGYGLVGRTSTLPEDVRNVFVQTLENSTSRAQVDQILTNAITNEFIIRQRFNVVPDSNSSDAVLSGTVTSFRVRPVTFSPDGRAREYEILITARMEFKRTGEDEILWKNPAYLFRETYELSVLGGDLVDIENVAIREAADKFAETMVIDLLEGF